MNFHPQLEEIARQRELELRRRVTRPRLSARRTSEAVASERPRAESLATLLRAARAANAQQA